ncbi:hypothetical protein ABVT39_016904 [Epinephelus coioides]
MLFWVKSGFTDAAKANESVPAKIALILQERQVNCRCLHQVSLLKDNEGLDDNDTSIPAGSANALGFKIAHLSLIVTDRTEIDPPHSQALNFNTGTDSPPQCDANARLHSVTPVDKRQHFEQSHIKNNLTIDHLRRFIQRATC